MLFKMLLALLALVAFAVGQGIPDDRCLPIVPGVTIRLPHDTDCTLFYVCHFGERLLMPACPGGFQFDTPSLQCRQPPVTCGPIATTTSKKQFNL